MGKGVGWRGKREGGGGGGGKGRREGGGGKGRREGGRERMGKGKSCLPNTRHELSQAGHLYVYTTSLIHVPQAKHLYMYHKQQLILYEEVFE